MAGRNFKSDDTQLREEDPCEETLELKTPVFPHRGRNTGVILF